MQNHNEATPDSTKKNTVTTLCFWGDSLNKSHHNSISLSPEDSSMLPSAHRLRHRKSTQTLKDGNCCSVCTVTSTPMWRSGPKGVPLCNACGLQYSKKSKKQSQQLIGSIVTLSNDNSTQQYPSQQTNNRANSEINTSSNKRKLANDETSLPSIQSLINSTIITTKENNNTSDGSSFFSETNKTFVQDEADVQSVDVANTSLTNNQSGDVLEPSIFINDECQPIQCGTFETYARKKSHNSTDFFNELSTKEYSYAEKKTKGDNLAAIVDLPFQNSGPR